MEPLCSASCGLSMPPFGLVGVYPLGTVVGGLVHRRVCFTAWLALVVLVHLSMGGACAMLARGLHLGEPAVLGRVWLIGVNREAGSLDDPLPHLFFFSNALHYNTKGGSVSRLLGCGFGLVEGLAGWPAWCG
ncbi:hypothetical protein CHARACLAT_026748 [Characodon lateralis]|uniref:Uncharacterized protein n=1 Tax=Characodon lateralis TaxID=208331 RepID=A0ABU7D110_9TELE|nr:hypothetical protein [Characodon lateralis]